SRSELFRSRTGSSTRLTGGDRATACEQLSMSRSHTFTHEYFFESHGIANRRIAILGRAKRAARGRDDSRGSAAPAQRDTKLRNRYDVAMQQIRAGTQHGNCG